MHFRVRYALRGFDFLNSEIAVLDRSGEIEVRISKHPDISDEPPHLRGKMLATAVCEREVPGPVLEQAISSGLVFSRKEGAKEALDDLAQAVLRTLRLIRWRANFPGVGHNPVQWGPEQSWSLDGCDWKGYED
jgi:hypothetical protein